MTIGEILAAIGAYVADDKAKAKEVAQGLRSTPETKIVAQLLLNAGAGKKKGEADEKVQHLQTQVDQLTTERDELAEQLETAQKAPDDKAMAWDKERTKLLARAEKAERERDEERQGRGQDAIELSVSRFLGHLKGRVDEFGMDALQRRFRERFRLSEDRKVQYLDAEGEVIDPPKGKTPEEILADEAFETVPAGNRQRQMNAGGGSGNGGGTGTVTLDVLATEKAQSGAYRM